MKFNHLNVPTHWQNYWTRYPEGHTILEALISWVSQVDSMVDNQNILNGTVEQFRNEIDEFVERFEGSLQAEVTQTLNDWQTSGFLDVVISEALQWQLDDYIATNEQDKLSLTAHLQQTEEQVNLEPAISLGDITDLISGHDKNIVLTGDSLSFNYHDFVNINLSNTADQNYSGLMSWAHILRDTIKRNDNFFKHAEELNISVKSSVGNKTYNLSQLKYGTPFNNKNVFVTLKKDDTNSGLEFKFSHTSATNKAVLHMNQTTSGYACIFDVYVDGVLTTSNIDNGGRTSYYNGSAMFEVAIDFPGDGVVRTIELKNFRPSVVTPLNTDGVFGVILNAVGTKKTNVFLTGEGGVQSGWFLTNLQERVLQHNPDFVALILGANDIYHETTVAQYKANMQSIVTQIRTKNADTQILLMTSPSMSHANTPDEKTKQYNAVLRELAVTNKCYFIDLLKLFENTATSDWRFDNVHLNKKGSAILGKNVVDLLMPSTIVDKKYLDPDYYVPYNHHKDTNLLALENAWQHMTNEGYYGLQWTQEGNRVRVFGNVKGGSVTPGHRICSLPTRIRPKKYMFFDATSINGATLSPCLLGLTNGSLNVSYGVANTHLIIDFVYDLD